EGVALLDTDTSLPAPAKPVQITTNHGVVARPGIRSGQNGPQPARGTAPGRAGGCRSEKGNLLDGRIRSTVHRRDGRRRLDRPRPSVVLAQSWRPGPGLRAARP